MESLPNLKPLIKNKYNDLLGSKEVSRAFKVDRRNKKADGNTIEDIKDQRLEIYFSRLNNIVKDDRGFELLKQKVYNTYLTKEQDIPDSYYENIMRDSGHLGVWRDADDNQRQEYRKQNSEVLLEDQKSSLEEWLDYFKNTESNYIPDEIKYYIFRNVVNMTEYNKDEKKFDKKSKATVKKFPDLNHKALSYLVDGLIKKYEGKDKEFEHDIQEDEKENFKQFLAKEDFVKLYGWCYENFKPIPEYLLPITDGIWKKYLQNNSHKELVDSIKGKGTGWCTAGEQTAKSHLKTGDFYVYYSEDDNKEATIPRIAIRMEADEIAEVRGIAYKQNLDSYMVDILKDKLEEFPDKEKYLKKERDNTQLTIIDKKVRKNESLNKTELEFMYQINSKIDGFGYQDDPRISEILSTRNKKEDASIILECSKEEIATNTNEITENTKAYIGPLGKDIFTKLSNIDHIYASFPNSKVNKLEYNKDIIYPTNKQEWLDTFSERNINLEDSNINEMLEKMEYTNLPADQKFITLSVKDLFNNTQPQTYQDICNKAEELGLELCAQDDGPKLRLSHEQQSNSYFRTAMKSIMAGGYSRVWLVDRNDDERENLGWYRGESAYLYDGRRVFAFRLRK